MKGVLPIIRHLQALKPHKEALESAFGQMQEIRILDGAADGIAKFKDWFHAFRIIQVPLLPIPAISYHEKLTCVYLRGAYMPSGLSLQCRTLMLSAWESQAGEAWKALGGWITGASPQFGPGTKERFEAAAKMQPEQVFSPAATPCRMSVA